MQVRTAVCTSSPTGLLPAYFSNLHLHPQCFSMVYYFLFMSNSHTHAALGTAVLSVSCLRKREITWERLKIKKSHFDDFFYLLLFVFKENLFLVNACCYCDLNQITQHGNQFHAHF